MTVYRLMDGVAGRPGTGSSGTQPPAAGTSFSGNYIAGLAFEVTSFGLWFQGYWWWVPATVSQTTTGQKFALWQVTGTNAGTVIPNSSVTAGVLTANAWNYVPLATPLALTAGVAYNAATGYVSTTGFPKTGAQFGTGDPYSAGFANGPLTAYSSTSGSNTVGGASWLPQQPFSTAGSDPAAIMPVLNDADDLLWIDIQVSDQAPAGATYRAFPDMPVASLAGGGPQSLAYTLGMEFSVSQACTLQKIWHYSAPTSTVLPTRCGIWVVGSQTELGGSDNSSPSWLLPAGGAASAAAGWVYCDYTSAGVTLAAGVNYKVATFTADNTDVWFGTTTNYWSSGPGGSGITTGPLSLPNNAGASPGQSSWHQSATWTYPDTSSSPENDWIDVEVLPLPPPFTGPAYTASMSSM
jgi:hypothetical protein